MEKIGRKQKAMSLLKSKNTNFIFVCVLGMFFSQYVLADTTYSVKSTVKENNSQDVIRLDVLPVVNTNIKNSPATIKSNPAYIAPLIEPAKADKPALNFNLKIIKNIKQ